MKDINDQLNQEEIYNLNSLISIKKLYLLMKLPTKESPGPHGFKLQGRNKKQFYTNSSR